VTNVFNWRERAKAKALAQADDAADPVGRSWLRGLTGADVALAKRVIGPHPAGRVHNLRDDDHPEDRGGLLYVAPEPKPRPPVRRLPNESLAAARARWAASPPYVDPGCAPMSQRPGRYVNLPKDTE
jgi:hypothetical protein